LKNISSLLIILIFLFNNNLLLAQSYESKRHSQIQEPDYDINLLNTSQLQLNLQKEINIALHKNYILITDSEHIYLSEEGLAKAKELIKRKGITAYLKKLGWNPDQASEDFKHNNDTHLYNLGLDSFLGWGMVLGGILALIIDRDISFLLRENGLRDMARAIDKTPFRTTKKTIIRRSFFCGIILFGTFLLYSNDVQAQGLPADWYLTPEDRISLYRSDIVKEHPSCFYNLHPDDAEKINYEARLAVYNTTALLKALNSM
jgi:hypothetical protein